MKTTNDQHIPIVGMFSIILLLITAMSVYFVENIFGKVLILLCAIATAAFVVHNVKRSPKCRSWEVVLFWTMIACFILAATYFLKYGDPAIR